MKKSLWWIVLCLLLGMTLALSGCVSGATEVDQEASDEKEEHEDNLEGENADENDGLGGEGVEETEEEEPDTQEDIGEDNELGFEPPYEFSYPDAVRGVYVTGHSAGGQRFEDLLALMDQTTLNAMVIDIKDDWGHLTFRPEDEEEPLYPYSKRYIKDIHDVMQTLEEHEVYPIARIVVFKDSVIAKEKPEWSYTDGSGNVWRNSRDESFINPFLQEVWDYNLQYAKLAAEAGFKEIQFDYVRFPEGFEKRDRSLNYSMGDYHPGEITDENGEVTEDMVQARVQAVTDFVAYAKQELEPYGVDVSVDIFGYSATLSEAPGIGQNFSKISEHVDVISSMIYPSHWTPYFGIAKPDLEPYRLVQEYAKMENRKLYELEEPPTSRPWLQDFTASWLGRGNYLQYGVPEVEAQIKALNEAGIWEFLLWNANNRYTEGVNYLPLGPVPELEERESKRFEEAEQKALEEEEQRKAEEEKRKAEEEKRKAEEEQKQQLEEEKNQQDDQEKQETNTE
ncbi:putative glycoside hydrolase [Caldalkalibacillus salinus]|uniref:putative glycoside hydrolase n=1 Tax=Caldalkalibacillus salinus TaxID=2803787 RepID=UPI001F29A72D|nr:putative glycoside hydrolase [Caldalkalibacillus salinus]